MYHDASDTLLPHSYELWLLPGDANLGLLHEAAHVVQGTNGGCYEPGKTDNRTHENQ